VVVDGMTGYVVAVDDLDALVERARSLVTDGARRERLGAAARRHCEEQFSLAASIGRWEALLAPLMGERCTSST
jgi:glycosyltransferase involved in cell wall biosynthesis